MLPRMKILKNAPIIKGFAATVGKKEGEGPLEKWFDEIHDDTTLGEASWEKAESGLQMSALTIALKKAVLKPSDMDYVLAGDLLNQCMGSSFGLREFGIPLLGLYGACSTMALSLSLAAMLVDSGYAKHAAAVTSSHFCSAERQFRYPLEYGGQRTPTAQWTVTGAGSVIVSSEKNANDTEPYIYSVTHGKILDLGVKDANNMGAAMAPAAADTITAHLKCSGASPDDFDLILTGDLGSVGSDLLQTIMKKDGIDIKGVHDDCGTRIFDLEGQDVHAGGSGCGCSASVLCSEILTKLHARELTRVLFCATGALMSTTSAQQGESIPGIAHAIEIRV